MYRDSENSVAVGRVYVVGDIHGCKDELRVILEYVQKHERLSASDMFVFLGDYVDRGADSKDVIQLLIDFKAAHSNTIFLRGNHEAMLSDFLLGGTSLGFSFLRNGGIETISSYGVKLSDVLPESLAVAMPSEHIKFFNELESLVYIGDEFICVHAGLNPRQSLESQSDSELCWIRDEFISSPHSFGRVIVFGHTPWRDIMLDLPYKIGIDTGLVFGNKLTCLELRSGKVIQVYRKSRKVSVSKINMKILTEDGGLS